MPLAPSGCGLLGFAPEVSSQPTTDQAESPSGLDFDLDINDEGLTNPTRELSIRHQEGRRHPACWDDAQPLGSRRPRGLLKPDPEPRSSPPSLARAARKPPRSGTLEVETPILEGKILKGQVFVAQQDDPARRTGGRESLRHPDRDLPGDPQHRTGRPREAGWQGRAGHTTGQLITTFDDIPQFPFSHLRFHFREGGRSPLITPPACGIYTTQALCTPWANPAATLPVSTAFQITQGVGGGPCPPGGPLPFDPGFSAGSVNADAGAYSPFNMRLIRHDGEQDLTKSQPTLPPASPARSPASASAPMPRSRTPRRRPVARSRPLRAVRRARGSVEPWPGRGSAPSSPTSPAASTWRGYQGDPLSVVAITPAIAGPFDAGTVVVRVALTLNPITAQIEVDGSAQTRSRTSCRGSR